MPATVYNRDSDAIVYIYAGGQDIRTRPHADGGGKSQVIPKGQFFQGRRQGGATRSQIYGSHDYGSGYPGGGITRGTNGRDFPFYFWPIVWTDPFIIDSGDAYLHPIEYGLPDNTTRPGGPLATLTYISNTPAGSTFRVLTDFTSAVMLTSALSVCSPLVNLSSAMPSPYLVDAVTPLPEQTLQYFRASSAALTLDGYNNTAALLPQDSEDSHSVLLPGGTDFELLNCLNTTIGSAIIINDPPVGKSLSFVAVLWIVIGSLCAAIFALILCRLCTKCRATRVRNAQRPLASPSLPGTIHAPIREPPRAVIPSLGDFSSGKAGEYFEEDDDVSLTKNAQAFAGTGSDAQVNYDRRATFAETKNPWWWTSFSGRSNKGFENIEMNKRYGG